MNIPLGFEIGTGVRVSIPVNHTVVLGQTQLSGKTTTLEAMVTRSELRAIGFITKPGEKSFRLQTQIPAFFSESTIGEYWKYVVAIVENLMAVKLGWQERGWIVKLCQDYEREKTKTQPGYKWKRPKSLRELLANVEIALPHLRGTPEMICIQLREYLKPAVKEIESTEFSSKLELRPGINVMDITELSDGLKALVIRSVIEWVHKHGRKIVVIIPEAWKFIPEGRSTPVKLALEGLIREGAGVGNFVWMDSQDLRGVDKLLLRSVIVWLFGVQRQKNEVASTLASIPDHPKPSATAIMQLGKGEFYVCYGTTLMHTYVQPAGMEDVHAQAIALGQEDAKSWKRISGALDEQTKDAQAEENAKEMLDAGFGDQPPDVGADGARAGAAGEGARSNFDVPDIRDEKSSADHSAEEEETMWKEKYEELKKEFDAFRLSVTGSADAGSAERAAGAGDRLPSVPAGGIIDAIRDNGHCEVECSAPSMDAVYRYILERATKEKPASLLRVLADRTELEIRRERNVIQADASTLRGALGILISEKFFDGVREFGDARKELIRRGFLGSKAPNLQISQALTGLVELGFLTKEQTGYQSVASMKVHIMEAK